MNEYIASLLRKEKVISVIGLGYVGLPLALELARKFKVVGFDINSERVEMMKEGKDPSKELNSEAFSGTDIHFTSNSADLAKADFHIIAVPTPVDEHNVPNLSPILSASKSLGKYLSKGDIVVYESTVYPGCTEEDCIPALEEASGLTSGRDFKYGYSPERINPGDKNHTLTKILKIVSGSDEHALEIISGIYGSIIKAGIYKAPSIKVAEAAKVIENAQRDINIAFVNELSLIFDRMDIDTLEVLKAAGTKWNFLKFSPGLVGGHCIGVDPYYLAYKAEKLGYNPQVILSGRRINDAIPSHIAKVLVQKLIKKGKTIQDCHVLVMGITFKENVSDIRNSKVVDLVEEINSYSIEVDIVDPHASKEEVLDEYQLELFSKPQGGYDAIIVAVNHHEYLELDHAFFLKNMKSQPILMDLKGIYSFGKNEIEVWRL